MSPHSGRDASNEIRRIRVDSAFGYAALYRLPDILFRMGEAPRGIVLDMSEIPMLDASGLRALENFQLRCRRENVGLLLSEVRPQSFALLKGTRLMALVAKTIEAHRR